MEPLQFNRELMTAIRVCTPLNETSKMVEIRRHILVIITQMLLIFGWVSSIVFIVEYMKSDLGNALYAIFQVAGEFSGWYTLFISYLNPDSLLAVFIKLKDIRENGKQKTHSKFKSKTNYHNKNSNLKMFNVEISFIFTHKVIDCKKSCAKHFRRVDDVCHKLTRILVQGVVTVYIILSIVQGILNLLYCYYRNDNFDGIDPECLYVPYKFEYVFVFLVFFSYLFDFY